MVQALASETPGLALAVMLALHPFLVVPEVQ